MDLGNVAIGLSNYKDLEQQRAEKLQAMQIQKEQHAQNMETTDQAQEQMDLQLQQLKRIQAKQLRTDIYDALTPAIEDGDLGLLKQIMKDPNTDQVFGNIVDVRGLGTADADGEEFGDLVFESLGITDADKLTPAQKQDILREAKNKDLVVTTDAAGNKQVISIAKLAASTGYYGAKSKKEKDIAAAMAQTGNLELLYGYQTTIGDTDAAAKSLAAIEKLRGIKNTAKGGTGSSGTAAIKNYTLAAKYILKQEGKEPTKANLEDKIGELIYKGTYTASSKKVIESEAFAKAAEPTLSSIETKYAKRELTTEDALKELNSNPVLSKAVRKDRQDVFLDKRYKEAVAAMEGGITAIQEFGRFTQFVNDNHVDKNVLTSIGQAVSDKFSSSYKGDWSMEEIKKHESEIGSYVTNLMKTKTAEGMSQLATMALIKSMSGLAVSDEEAARYKKLLATGSTDDIHATMKAAWTFMTTKSNAIRSTLDRIGADYKAYALKQNLIVDQALGQVNIKRRDAKVSAPVPVAENGKPITVRDFANSLTEAINKTLEDAQ